MNTTPKTYEGNNEWPLVTDKNRPKGGYVYPYKNIGCDFATMQEYTKAFQNDDYTKMKELEEKNEKKSQHKITTNINIEIKDLLMFEDLVGNY